MGSFNTSETLFANKISTYVQYVIIIKRVARSRPLGNFRSPRQ
jgi:hypothetical protein